MNGTTNMVAEQASGLAAEVAVIVLAQASMQRLVPRCEEETGLRLLSSPRTGVERLAQVVHARAAAALG